MQPKLCVRALLALVCLLFMGISHAQPGTLDPSFGDGGIIKQRFLQNANTFNETALGVITQADGYYLVPLAVNNSTVLMRLTPGGVIDPSYGINGYSDFLRLQAISAVPAPDGGLFIAGRFSTSIGVARFDANGNLDKSFGKDGIATTPFPGTPGNVKDLVLQPDGKVVVVGDWNSGPNADLVLCRFNPDGTLDTGFGQQGVVSVNLGSGETATAAALQTDGKILVAGGSTNVGSSFNNMSLVRFNADGSLDLSFGNGGKVVVGLGASQSAHAVDVQPDGKILVAGGISDFYLLRFHTNGSPDASFGINGVATTNFFGTNEIAKSIQLLADGRILVAGDLRTTQGRGEFGVAAYMPNGSPDPGFGPSGRIQTVTNNFVSNVLSLGLQPDGKLMIAGAFQSIINQPRDYILLRLEPSGKQDASFGTFGITTGYYEGESSQFRSLAVQDGIITAGGTTQGPSGPRFSLARYHLDGTPDVYFGTGGKLTADLGGNTPFGDLALYPDGRILTGGSFSGNGIADFVLARFFADGSPDLSFGLGGKILSSFAPGPDNLSSVALQDDRILAGGTTTPLTPGFPVYVLARYLPDGTLDRSFGLNGSVINNFGYSGSILVSIKVLEDGKILTLARGTNTMNQFDMVLAQFLPDGSPDASFGNGGVARANFAWMDNALALETSGGKILVAGYFSEIINGSDSKAGLVQFNADGSLDVTFGENGRVLANVGLRSQANALSVQPDGRIVISGPVLTEEPKGQIFLARYQPDGSLDPTFGQGGTIIPDLPNDASVNRSLIVGERLYAAGLMAEISTYASIASFVLDVPVQLSCPPDTRQVADSLCMAVITGIDPVLTPQTGWEKVNYTFTGAINTSGRGSVDGFGFPKGITTVQYSLEQDSSRTCSFTVTVVDSTAPVLSGLSVSTPTLWPVNHKMRDVEVSYTVSDNCGPVAVSLSVVSNEDAGNPGNGNASPDWEIVNDHLVRLKAERAGNGDARIYTIKVTGIDDAGNTSFDSVRVSVPRDLSSVVSAGRSVQGTLEENRNSLRLNVLANPSTTKFSLMVEGTEAGRPVSLKVTDAAGRLVEVRTNLSPDAVLHIGSRYQPGIYFVQLVQGGKTVQAKLVKL